MQNTLKEYVLFDWRRCIKDNKITQLPQIFRHKKSMTQHTCRMWEEIWCWFVYGTIWATLFLRTTRICIHPVCIWSKICLQRSTEMLAVSLKKLSHEKNMGALCGSDSQRPYLPPCYGKHIQSIIFVLYWNSFKDMQNKVADPYFKQSFSSWTSINNKLQIKLEDI